jgi:hypothetical protein
MLMNTKNRNHKKLKLLLKLSAAIGIIVAGAMLTSYLLDAGIICDVWMKNGCRGVDECHICCTDNSCALYHDRDEKMIYNLSKKGATAEKEFSCNVMSNTEQLIEEYKQLPETMNGKIVDIDRARHLYELYRRQPSKYTTATHAGAAEFVKILRKQKLDELIARKNGYVVYLAGGAAAGKGTATMKFLMPLINKADIVIDGTFSNYNFEYPDLVNLLENGITVSLVYVYRPINDALEGVIERCKKTGRVVPLSVIARSHYFAMKTTLRVLEQKREQLHFYLVTSGKTIDDMKFVDAENSEASITFLKAHQCPSFEDALMQVIKAYDKANKKGLSRSALNEFEKDAACAREALKKIHTLTSD